LNLLEYRELERLRGPEALGDIMEHLATYLLKGDLCDAKLLWKRIPAFHKENPELAAIWGVGQALWLRDMPKFYSKARSFEWSPRIQSIMPLIIASVQEKMVRLIGAAYTSIQPGDVSTLLGVSLADVEAIVRDKGWAVVDGLIEPKEPPPEEVSLTSAEYQIEKLTDFVSFLEN